VRQVHAVLLLPASHADRCPKQIRRRSRRRAGLLAVALVVSAVARSVVSSARSRRAHPWGKPRPGRT